MIACKHPAQAEALPHEGASALEMSKFISTLSWCSWHALSIFESVDICVHIIPRLLQAF